MPRSLPSFRSRSSQESRRSLPYNLRSRVPPSSVSNHVVEDEAETSSSTSTSDIIFEDFHQNDNQNEQSSIEDDPPTYDSVISDPPIQNSNPLSDGIPYRHGEPIPDGYTRHAAMVARIRQINLERLHPQNNPIVDDLRSQFETTQAEIRKLRELHLKVLKQIQKIENKIDTVCRRSDRLREALRQNGDLPALRDYVEGERLLPDEDLARHN
jgi:hypothetical protein